MTRFYCPGCWKDFEEDLSPCPYCRLDIREFWDSKEHIEKLIVALHHPEGGTPVRSAWLLGKTGDRRAVPALIDLFIGAKDIYIAVSAVRALGEMGLPEAMRFLETLLTHPVEMIRREARRVLGEDEEDPASTGSIHGIV